MFNGGFLYGFRGACPDIFTDYRRRWSEGNGGNAVFMSENFRCGEGIIDFSNLVSRHIFSTGATPFDAADELVFSKKYDGDTPPVYRPAQLCLVEKPEDSDGENREAQYVADRIAALLSGETLDSGSPVRARDIAILLRSSTRAEDYARALAERGIPVSNEISENFFAYGEVMLIICLLRSADNPLRDIYLAGAMKSPLFGFTLEELLGLKYEDINYEKKTILSKNICENNKLIEINRRTLWKEVRIPDKLLSMLPKNQTGPIFTNIKIDNIESLRNTFLFLCIDKKVPFYVIAKQLGYNSLQVFYNEYKKYLPNECDIDLLEDIF